MRGCSTASGSDDPSTGHLQWRTNLQMDLGALAKMGLWMVGWLGVYPLPNLGEDDR